MRYRRSYVEGGTYFFTVNLQDRRKSLLVEHIAVLRSAVAVIQRKKPFEIDAWVVLPDHMHAVWTLPENDSDYTSRWREIKKRFSQEILKVENSLVSRKRGVGNGIWQARFWEHTIRDGRDYEHHIDYVHINPLKHGFVTQVKDWPYSSFHRAVKRGEYPINWGGESDLKYSNESFGERR